MVCGSGNSMSAFGCNYMHFFHQAIAAFIARRG
jgi:hypothetical protein